MPAPRRANLDAVARRQFGVFTLAQAREAGVDPRTVRAWVRRGEAELLHLGTFRMAGAAPAREASWLAVLLHLGGDAVLCRRTAAQVHGMPVASDGFVHVLTRARSGADLANVVQHRTSRLQAADVVMVGALRVTSATRTICDLAGELDRRTLRRVVADAVRRGLTNARKLRRCIDWLGTFRGRAALRGLIDELDPLDHQARSELETRFLRLMTRAGLPPTAMNHRVVDAEGRVRYLDAVWLPERLPVELDGAATHSGLLDGADDRRRENAVVATGWRPFLRFSWDDITRQGDAVVASVERALAEARAAQ